jgi:predicted transposase YbfD/YdcC
MSAGSVIAVDGKTVRGSENGERKAIHIVSAWADEVGQVQTVEKSNEITVIPALLEMIALKGCMVTIDAMGCQYKIANQIVSAGANYVTSLPADPALFGASVRAHWGIENSLHYVLDVAFGEDACRIKSGNAPENLAFIRKIARSMARSDTQSSRSITSRIKQMA